MSITFVDALVLLGIPSIIAFLFQVLFGNVIGKRKKAKQNEFIIKKALQAILRDRLRAHYIRYMEQGFVDIADKENFDNMYQIYHTLGENGVMDGMYEKVMSLPLAPKVRGTRGKKQTIEIVTE